MTHTMTRHGTACTTPRGGLVTQGPSYFRVYALSQAGSYEVYALAQTGPYEVQGVTWFAKPAYPALRPPLRPGCGSR